MKRRTYLSYFKYIKPLKSSTDILKGIRTFYKIFFFTSKHSASTKIFKRLAIFIQRSLF